jgi:hypothetical protein
VQGEARSHSVGGRSGGNRPRAWRRTELWATPAGRNSGAALAGRSEASISISIAVLYLVRRELTIQRLWEEIQAEEEEGTQSKGLRLIIYFIII